MATLAPSQVNQIPFEEEDVNPLLYEEPNPLPYAIGLFSRIPFRRRPDAADLVSEQTRGKAGGQSKFGGDAFYVPNPRNVAPVSNSRLSPLPPEPATRAGIVIEEKNWPPFLPLIHHDIANEILSHLQRMQYFAFASFLEIIICALFLKANGLELQNCYTLPED